MSEEKCQRCGELGYDRRNLWMACLYDMQELGLPFEDGIIDGRKFYVLRVCKSCRGSWMKAIKDWFHAVSENIDSPNSGIFIREYGAIKEVSLEDFKKIEANKPTRSDELVQKFHGDDGEGSV